MPVKRRSDARLNDSGVRKDRGMEDATRGSRVLTDGQRLAEFRQMSFQSALPDIPAIDGFHVCWLTTENPRDPIHARMRMGYQPIKATDIPGWEFASMKTGEWEGCIGVNEMLAFKLPLGLYESYMYENHHQQPLEEEGKLNTARRMAEEDASNGAKERVSFQLEEGTSELGIAPEPSSFEDNLTSRARPI